MDLSGLKPAKGSVRKRKRIGKGEGSGIGGTSTRGHKGQKSRSGYSRKFGFEGGQQPLHKRLPKFGFKNINRIRYRAINLDTLQHLVNKNSAKDGRIEKINLADILANGLASKKDLVKILGRGVLKSKLEVEAHAFSKSARAALEQKGGKALVVNPYSVAKPAGAPADLKKEEPLKAPAPVISADSPKIKTDEKPVRKEAGAKPGGKPAKPKTEALPVKPKGKAKKQPAKPALKPLKKIAKK